jgi:hypothetical protein
MRVLPVLIIAVVLNTLGARTLGSTQSRSSPPAPTGVVLGRVVDATTGTGIRGARVTLSQIIEAPAREPANAPGRTVVTTADGGYAFPNLGAGRYTINASKRGYLSGGVGARRPGGRRQLLVLVEGETVNASAITLWMDAAISGLVLDEGGEPVVGARVRALRQAPPRGAEFGGESWTTTDDRGSYRLFGVPPGDYLVVVSSILLDGSLIYPLTFYPSAQVPERAAIIAVAPGDERTGVDFQLTPASGVEVRGRVEHSNGPAEGIPVTLRLPDAELVRSTLEVASTVSGPAGEFSFNAVSTGTYVLHAADRQRGFNVSPDAAVKDTYGRWTILVGDRDAEHVVLQLRPGVRVGGRLVFDGGVKPMPSLLAATRVYLDRLDERSSVAEPATPDRLGRFTTAALPPGQYRVRVGVIPSGWMFKSATYEGRNIADESIELDSTDIRDVVVTFTTKGTRLSGVIRSDRGEPDPETSVLIYPADRALWTPLTSVWRMHSVRASGRGTYTFTSMPPGEYYVVAVPEEQVVNWYDPHRLAALAPRATRIRILEGQVHVQDLRTVRDR